MGVREMNQELAGASRGERSRWHEFGFQAGQEIMHVVQDNIATGNQYQGNSGGEKDPETQADSHGNEELSLETPFQNHGDKTGKGGQ